MQLTTNNDVFSLIFIHVYNFFFIIVVPKRYLKEYKRQQVRVKYLATANL